MSFPQSSAWRLVMLASILGLAVTSCTSDDAGSGQQSAGGSAGSGGASSGGQAAGGTAGTGGTSVGGSSGGGTGGSATGGSATGGAATGEIGPDAAECQDLTPLPTPCEATGSGRCLYIDPQLGDDTAGDGTQAHPWRTLANIVSYYGTPGEQGSTPKPSSATTLAPGDVVYLFGGMYSSVYNYQGYEQVARFRGVSGTATDPIRIKAYPGQGPVIDGNAQGSGIVLAQLSHFELEGLEIKNTYGPGVRLEEADEIRLHRLHVHDVDGIDNDNIAGVYVVGSTSVELSCSNLHDNYDRHPNGGSASENNSDVVLFGGGGIRVHHNKLWQSLPASAPVTGGCIKYKHAATLVSASFEVDHNLLSNCKFFGVGTGTQHTHVHHNLITRGEGIVSRDFGGPTHQTDQLFEHNTLYQSTLSFYATDGYANGDFADPSQFEFRRNIIVHELPQPGQERATVLISPYGNDALFDKTVPALAFSQNCYLNTSGSVAFSLFAAGGSWGDKGGLYSLTEWQALGFDTDSLETDPRFVAPQSDDFHLAADSPCAQFGAFAP
ncbi:MAG: right-handed parallel beta-helix repeat-containing protein [Polyangiaceae bacterium]